MNRVQAVLSLGLFLAPCLPASSPVQGGSGMVPSLGEAMPLESREGAIVLSRPIALAPGRILAAGTIFRSAFRTPTPKEIQRANQGRNSSELEKTYSGRRTGISALEGDTRTEMERALEFKAAEPAWSDPLQLAAFFHTLPADDYFIAIQSSPEAKPEVLQFKFPDDILLAQADAGVEVRAVRPDSAAGRSGLQAGMLIDTVGGTPTGGSLAAYLQALPRARSAGQESGGHLQLTVRDSPEATPRPIAIRLPRSLSNTDDFFSDILAEPKP